MKEEKEKEKTFEENINELETIVKELETGSCSLEDAMDKFSKGMKLAKMCSDKLDNATEKVNKILTENGELADFEEPQE